MKIRIDVIKSILILSLICLIVAGALAVVNHFTSEKIKIDSMARAYGARTKIIPEADGFTKMDIEDLHVKGIPEAVIEAYQTTNNKGYVFTMSVKGFGRENMKLLCGIDMDGNIIVSNKDDLVLSHTETPSYFNRVFTDLYLKRYWGNNKAVIEEVDTVSGATISSTALKNAMRYALLAFELIGEINE